MDMRDQHDVEMVCPMCGKRYPASSPGCPEHGATLVPQDPHAGRLIAERYRLWRVVGRGSMGSVYEARHLSTGRRVAVKLLSGPLARDLRIVARFRREAQIASRLRHENCVQVDDFGEDTDGTFFLVMEFVDGQSLADEISGNGGLPVTRSVDIALQILLALDAAHTVGVLHRDLKPENVMLMPLSGRPDFVKVVDFGIAKLDRPALHSDRAGMSSTIPGMLLGTPAFMSPEQTRGEEMDTRSDLYAVAVILWHMLAGAPPFWRNSVEDTVKAICYTWPDRLSNTRSDVPTALEDVLYRGMGKKRDDRYASAVDFIEALKPFASAGAANALVLSRAPAPGLYQGQAPAPTLWTAPVTADGGTSLPPQVAQDFSENTAPIAIPTSMMREAQQSASPSRQPPAAASPISPIHGSSSTTVVAINPASHKNKEQNKANNNDDNTVRVFKPPHSGKSPPSPSAAKTMQQGSNQGKSTQQIAALATGGRRKSLWPVAAMTLVALASIAAVGVWVSNTSSADTNPKDTDTNTDAVDPATDANNTNNAKQINLKQDGNAGAEGAQNSVASVDSVVDAGEGSKLATDASKIYGENALPTPTPNAVPASVPAPAPTPVPTPVPTPNGLPIGVTTPNSSPKSATGANTSIKTTPTPVSAPVPSVPPVPSSTPIALPTPAPSPAPTPRADSPEVVLSKADQALANGNLSFAAQLYNQVLRTDSNIVKAREGLAIVAFRQGDWATAKTQFERLMQLGPSYQKKYGAFYEQARRNAEK